MVLSAVVGVTTLRVERGLLGSGCDLESAEVSGLAALLHCEAMRWLMVSCIVGATMGYGAL